ncbi:mitochondrial membrane protein [Entomophthora muscae]|uniref:Mitochondrial membrane protein n=1 Tax=Entomophthora muscae TaxID=34485 RepID=A0ACC2U203_9FUNG|nr:mitochondrial membrane protein [Entomophthora muscae]
MSEERLPFLAEAENSLPDAQLEVLRIQFNAEGPDASVQTKFDLAWGLIRSRNKIDIQEGIRMLHDIYVQQPERRRECQYYIALGNYKLGKYTEARVMNSYLLELEPQNPQALALKNLIENKVSRDGLVGMMMVGSVIAAIGVGAAYLFRGNKN